MRVSRKGQVVSALEADWLELTAAYYRKGWSLVDSFVYWDTPKGRFGPRDFFVMFFSLCCNDISSRFALWVKKWKVLKSG